MVSTGYLLRDDADNTLGLAVTAWELGEMIKVAQAQSSADHALTDWMAWWLLAVVLGRHGIDDDRAAAAEDKAMTLVAVDPAVDLKVVRHLR